jgi:hypothetical protein
LINLNVTNFFEKVVYDSAFHVKRETCWAISNLLAGPKKHIEHILNKTELLKALEIHSYDKDADVSNFDYFRFEERLFVESLIYAWDVT